MTLRAVKLLVWIGDEHSFQSIYMNVWRMGTNSLAVMYSTSSSASSAEDIKKLMIWDIVIIALFHLGVGLFLIKICGLLHVCSPWTRC